MTKPVVQFCQFNICLTEQYVNIMVCTDKSCVICNQGKLKIVRNITDILNLEHK